MNKIKELRLQADLSQKDLGEKIGVNQTAVGKYEREELEPNITILCKLANLFGCSIDYLVGRENDFGNIVVSNGASVPALTKEETWLLDMFRKLDEISQYKVLGYIQAFI